MLPPVGVAASFVPSAEEVILVQAFVAPTEVSSVQFAPLSLEIQMLPPLTVAARVVLSAEEASPVQTFAAGELFFVQDWPLSLEVHILPDA